MLLLLAAAADYDDDDDDDDDDNDAGDDDAGAAVGETFTRLKALWNAGAANDFVLREGIRFMTEETMLPILRQLAGGRDSNTSSSTSSSSAASSSSSSSVLVDFDLSGLSEQQVQRFAVSWLHGTYSIIIRGHQSTNQSIRPPCAHACALVHGCCG